MAYTSPLLDFKSNGNPYLPLICSCPPDCKCNDTESLKQWHHKYCSQEIYLTNQGDFICEGLQCTTYFIKNASFQCSVANKSNTWHCYKSIYQFIHALSQANQAAEMSLDDYDSYEFKNKLQIQVQKRWLTE